MPDATARLEVAAPQIRTRDDMARDAARPAPKLPTKEPAGEGPVEDAGQTRIKPFLPMIRASEYLAYKSRPHPGPAFPGLGKRNPAGNPGGAAAAVAVEAPRAAIGLTGPDFDGASAVDGLAPPDTHGAVGAQEFVETTNTHVDIFDKGNPANRISTPQAAFFGYFNQTLFDARAVYDSKWDRFILTTDAFPESADVQFFFIAVSTTPSAAGPYFIYQLNITFNSGDFWDFPQVGMDQDSIIVTANVFDAQGNSAADMFALPKAAIYNGLGFAVPVFTGLVGTLAPPIVLDNNSSTFLVAAPPSGSALQLYTLRDSSRAGINLSGPVPVAVDPYTMPPPAPQPAPCTDPADNLDTGDSRFANASTQVGNSLWQVHTINLVGFAAPKFYQINTATNSIDQSSFFFATGTSFDFNASIAANIDNDVFLTWNTTDPPAGTNVQVRFAGCDHAAGPCFPGPGTALFTSPTCITGDFDPRFGLQRWGDYSAVTVDPSNTRQAWLVNEKIDDAATWGSRIGAIGF
jgi:hypothetical protein